MAADADKVFSGSIPRLYESYLVPMIFEPYAAGLVERLRTRQLSRLLEVAAGTGVVTRALAAGLTQDVAIVATDLNQAMLDEASRVGTARPIEWRQADAGALPFEDGSFDAVVCQFGAMFFPDKPKAFAEFRRVLRPGGVLVFNVWDRLEQNDLPAAVSAAVAAMFPDDPPRFLARTPYGYFDRERIASDLKAGGFTATPQIDTVSARSRAASPLEAAIAFCQGTPLRAEIEGRGAGRLEQATTAAAAALAERFGSGPLEGRIQAHVVTVERT